MFKRKGGGSKAFWTMIKKNCTFLTRRLPLLLSGVMTIQSYELVTTNIKENQQTRYEPFFVIQELGVPTTLSFCGGRTDASNDDGYSDFLSVGSSELHLIKDSLIITFLFLSQSCDMTSLTMLNNWRRWSGWWGSPRSSSPLSSSTSLLSFFYSQIFCFTNHVRTPFYSETLRCSMLLAMP